MDSDFALRLADFAGDVALGGGFGLTLKYDQVARRDFLRPLARGQVVFVGFGGAVVNRPGIVGGGGRGCSDKADGEGQCGESEDFHGVGSFWGVGFHAW